MDSNEVVALITAGAFILGSVLAFTGSYVAARLTGQANVTQERERDRLADRRKRRAFQRQTLMEVQGELTKFARVTGEIWLFDEQTFKENGQFTRMPPELSERDRLARMSYSHLVERVVDETVRAALKRVSAVDMRLVTPTSLQSLDTAMRQFGELVQTASETLGTKLREYLTEEPDNRG